ncbi:MAG: RES family NAD+ phosphorylase [Microthrixaceae bacterium]
MSGTWPRFAAVAHDDTCRLIPGRYASDAEHVLSDLAETAEDLDLLVRLAGATNSRLQAQEEKHPAGLNRTDMVFGVPFSKIINGAFSYGGSGARFHPPGPRGAWYCALDVETCLDEVAHHRITHLRETAAPDEFNIPYRLFLADVHAQNFAVLDDSHPRTLECLDPISYTAGQALGERLRSENHAGVRYPSVRHKDGVCLAVLQAPVISNVRRGDVYLLNIRDYHFDGAVVAP